MTNKGKMTLGIISGAIAGTALGLLLAPAKGSQTRTNIRHTTSTWVNRFGKLFTRKNGQLQEEMNRARQRKAAAVDKVNRLKNGIGG